MAAKDPKLSDMQLSIQAVRPILHDGKLYEPGERLEVTPETALILVSSGAAQEIARA